jgi:hypothetical protein
MGEKMKHTKGPWRMEESRGKLFVASGIPTNGTIIANNIVSDSMFKPYPSIPTIDDAAKANANLIAAAPELLEACKRVLSITHNNGEGYSTNGKKVSFTLGQMNEIGELLRTAIHKAEGV